MSRAYKHQKGYNVTHIFLDMKFLILELGKRTDTIKKSYRIWYGDRMMENGCGAFTAFRRGYNTLDIPKKIEYFTEVLDQIDNLVMFANILHECKCFSQKDIEFITKYVGAIKAQMDDLMNSLMNRKVEGFEDEEAE